MKLPAALLLSALIIGPAAAIGYYNGWRVAALQPDGKETLDRRFFGTLNYETMTFALSAEPMPTYTVTLRDARKVLFSKRSLHADLCNHLLTGAHDKITQAPYSQFALMGTLVRRAPIVIEVSRSKNELNPFMLLSLMSNQTENSIDPFVVERDAVAERLILHPDDSCEDVTPRDTPDEK